MDAASPSKTDGVGSILDAIGEAARGSDTVSLGELVQCLGGRGFGPLLLVPALLEISPIGGIPGVPTLIAAIVLLFSVQILLGREHVWLPGFVERRTLPSGRLETAVEKLRPLGRWLDRWFHGRLPLLVSKPFEKAAAAIVALACLGVPALELVPFATTIPMAVVAVFGLAMTVRDGAAMAVAFALTLVAAWGLAALLL